MHSYTPLDPKNKGTLHDKAAVRPPRIGSGRRLALLEHSPQRGPGLTEGVESDLNS